MPSRILHSGGGVGHGRRCAVRGRYQRPLFSCVRRLERQDFMGIPHGLRSARVPVSFAIDGKQYIAVQSGWGVDAAKMQARLNLIGTWELPEAPQGGSIWVFALD